jgi:parallel beta-helix repeat protein
MLRFVSKLFRTRTSPRSLTHRLRRPLRLEMLEDRRVPAVLFVDPTHPEIGGAFPTITAAVNAAHPGDTIKVVAGTYHEGVDVIKPLTILGGQVRIPALEKPGPSIIAANPASTGFALDADAITIRGFTITQEADAIRTNGAFTGFFVLNNTFLDDQVGVHMNTTLVGEGLGNLISGNMFTSDGQGVAIQDDIRIDTGARNVVIRSNTLLAGAETDAAISVAATNVSTNIQVLDNTFTQDGGIDLASVNLAKIDGNIMLNPRTTAVLLDGGVTNAEVAHNTIVANQDTPVAGIVLGNGTVSTLDTGNTVLNNSISNLGLGILLNPANQTTISGNHIGFCKEDGILVEAGSTGNTVSGNIVSNNGGDGIGVSFAGGSRIARNTVRHNQSAGIELNAAFNNIVSNNTADANVTQGIDVNNGSHNNTVTGNTAEFNSTGFRVASNSNSNTLTSNVAALNNQDGFTLTNNIRTNTLTANTARANLNDGFTVGVDSASNTLNRNVAAGNLSLGFNIGGDSNILTGNTASRNRIDGFQVFGGTHNLIKGNTTDDNGRDGFFIDQDSLATIVGNVALRNGRDGIELLATVNSSVTGNRTQGNGDNGIDLDATSTGNHVTANTATGNGALLGGFDLFDGAGSATTNTWASNKAGTRGPGVQG